MAVIDPTLAKADAFTAVEVDVLLVWLRGFHAGVDAATLRAQLQAGLRLEHYLSLLPIPPDEEEQAIAAVLREDYAATAGAVEAAIEQTVREAADRSPLQGGGQGTGDATSGKGGY